MKTIDANLNYTVGLNPLRAFIGLKPIYPDWIYVGESHFNGVLIKKWINPKLKSSYFSGKVYIGKPCYAIKLLWFDMGVLIHETDVYLSTDTFTTFDKKVLNKNLFNTYYYFQRNKFGFKDKWNCSFLTNDNEPVRGVITKTQADSILYSWGLQ